jgi:hypothetical protein
VSTAREFHLPPTRLAAKNSAASWTEPLGDLLSRLELQDLQVSIACEHSRREGLIVARSSGSRRRRRTWVTDISALLLGLATLITAVASLVTAVHGG